MKRFLFLSLLLTLQSFVWGSFIIRQKFSEKYPDRWFHKKNDFYIKIEINNFTKSIYNTIQTFENYKKFLRKVCPNPQSNTFDLLDIYSYFRDLPPCDDEKIYHVYKNFLRKVRPDKNLLISLHTMWICYQDYLDVKKLIFKKYSDYRNYLANTSKKPPLPYK